MVVTLTGSNNFLLRAELHKRINAFVAEHTDMGLEQFDGEEAAYDRMREALESLPFLAPKKLVILRGPGANKQFVENTEKLLGNLPETTDVIIMEPKLDKRSGYYKYLHKNTDYQEYSELDENGLARWLMNSAREQNGQISSNDARYLVERVGVNQQLLSNELVKLLHYDATVTRETINLLVEATSQSTIFELLEAAFAGNGKKAMALYDEQRRQRVEPQQIMAMLAWQLHVLALVKAAMGRDPNMIAKEAKLNPFVVRKSVGIAGRLSGAELKQLVHEALELDVRMKSEAIDADEALRAYLLGISHL